MTGWTGGVPLAIMSHNDAWRTERTMIAVEYDELACVVTVTGRPAALRALARRLEQLAERAELGREELEHLYSEEWAGTDLAVVPADPASRGTVVHHVRLHGLPA